MKTARIAWGVGLVSLGLSALACSSDDKGSTTGAQTGSGGDSSSGGSSTGSGGTSTGSGGASSGGPTIALTAPTEGASVDISTSPDVPVTLEITGFTLKDPASTDGGACAKDTCGHVHLLVDQGDGVFTNCNDAGKQYNEAAVALTDNHVGLDYCKKQNGPHTIKAELHNDDLSPVNGADGKVITSNLVNITATGAP